MQRDKSLRISSSITFVCFYCKLKWLHFSHCTIIASCILHEPMTYPHSTWVEKSAFNRSLWMRNGQTHLTGFAALSWFSFIGNRNETLCRLILELQISLADDMCDFGKKSKLFFIILHQFSPHRPNTLYRTAECNWVVSAHSELQWLVNG